MNMECAPITVWRAANFTFQIASAVCFMLVQSFGIKEHRESPEEPLMKRNKSMRDASVTCVYRSSKCQEQIVWKMLFNPLRSKWVLSKSCLRGTPLILHIIFSLAVMMSVYDCSSGDPWYCSAKYNNPQAPGRRVHLVTKNQVLMFYRKEKRFPR